MPIVRRTLAEIRKRGGGQVDWARVRNTTDEEIDAMTASDPDTPPEMTLDLDWRKVISPHVPDIRTLRRKLGLSQSSSRRSSASASAPSKSGSRDVRFRIAPPASF